MTESDSATEFSEIGPWRWRNENAAGAEEALLTTEEICVKFVL